MDPEDVIFYFDLARKGVVSKKTITKEVKELIKHKEKRHPGCNYGIVRFQQDEENPSFHETLAKDEAEFEHFVQDNLKFTSKSHPLEQGIMLASTYLVDAFRTSDNMLRMIVISDGPTEGSSFPLAQALMDLLENLKHVPVFIDVIRVGDQRIYPDDVKLSLVTGTTGGALHYASSDKEFKQVMDALRTTEHQRPEGSPPETVRSFFEGLCWDVFTRGDATGDACLACKGTSSGELVSCGNCNAVLHVSCLATRARGHHACFPSMCRCPACGGLLAWERPKTREHHASPATAGPSRDDVSGGVLEFPDPGSLPPASVQPGSITREVPTSTREAAGAQQVSLQFPDLAASPPGPEPDATGEPAAPGTTEPAPVPARKGGISLKVKELPGQSRPDPVKEQDKPAGVVFKSLAGQDSSPAPARKDSRDDDITVVSMEQVEPRQESKQPDKKPKGKEKSKKDTKDDDILVID